MLEKQKEWCQNKVEKGKKWVEDHKFGMKTARKIRKGSTRVLWRPLIGMNLVNFRD